VQHRSPARFLAPIAVLGSAGAIYLIVHSGVKDEPTRRPVQTRTAAPKQTGAKATYVVRSGDTLSAISDRTGISLADLEQLNPTVDANALHAGQKLKLRKRQTS
jgi:LysM repeat protein